MSSFSFTSYSLLSGDGTGGSENIVVPPSTTYYSRAFNITSIDSIQGVFLTLVGTRYGTLAGDVALQIQQACLPDTPSANWNDVGLSVSIGTAGTVGSPEAYNLVAGIFPAIGESLMPYLRFKLTMAAGASITCTKAYRTTKGRG